MPVSSEDILIPWHNKMSCPAQVLRSLYKPQMQFCRIKDLLQVFVTSLENLVCSLCLSITTVAYISWMEIRRKGKRKNVKCREYERNRNCRVFPSSKKNIIYFLFACFPTMLSFLLLVASGEFSLFCRRRHGSQYQNCVLFNAIRQWKSVAFMVTSVTVGSIGSIERDT